MAAAVTGALFLKISSAVRFSSYYAASNNTFGNNYGALGFDASRSSQIYGAAETVQPPALALVPQIKY